MKQPLDIRRVRTSDDSDLGVLQDHQNKHLDSKVNRLRPRATEWMDSLAPYLFSIGLALLAAYLVTNFFSKQATNKSEILSIDQSTDKVNTTPSNTSTDVGFTPKSTTPAVTTPIPVSSTTPTTIAKDSFKIRILNGSGVNGLASKIKDQLSTAGFSISSTGNAKKFDYPSTLIYYIANNKPQAELVKTELHDRETSLEEASQAFVGSDSQILIVLGEK